MSKNKTYRRMVGSQRWASLAVKVKSEANWQCSKCGRITTRLAVHHVIPLESARSESEMEELCFCESNLQVLCYQCHNALHMMEKYKNKIQKHGREKERVDKFFEKFVETREKEGSDETGE